MKKNKRIAATLLLLILLGLVLVAAAKKYYAEGRERSFERLTEYTREAAEKIRMVSENDQEYLQRMTTVLAQYELTDSKKMRRILSELENMGTVSRIEILIPGDRVLTRNGVADTSGKLSFQDISKKGIHISHRSSDLTYPDRKVLRYYFPIKKNGQTAAVLCGVSDLSKWPEEFTVEGYGDKMELFIMEGGSGDFLMDTWRSSLGNINIFNCYTLKKGYSEKQMESDFAEGKAGTSVFYSENVPGYYYARYVPVGIQDWMVMLTVPEKIAYAQAERMLYSYYFFAALLLVIFLSYLFWILWEIKGEKAASERQLKNVQFILEVEKELFDAHIRPEHFAAALQKTAGFLNAEAAFFWLFDTKALTRQHLWSSREYWNPESERKLLEFLKDLESACKDQAGFLSYDMDAFCRQHNLDREICDQFEIRSLMVIPVNGLDGRPSMLLGACNMEYRWKNTDPLEQVSLSFSMAVNHYEAHQALIRMGQVDTLTGLMNRNSFHADMDMLTKEKHESLACIYMDANGLHEINNHLGHQEGDEMLKAVAEALRASFPGDSLYRIGGDEFVVLCRNRSREEVESRAGMIRKMLTDPSYDISVGIEWREKDFDIEKIVNTAEAAMQEEKQRYYRENGSERQIRCLDQRVEQMILEKKDADTFLSVLAPEFKGVYFVNLSSNMTRHLYIPPYFEEYLREANDQFNVALMIYARRTVKPEYHYLFEKFCDYEYLEGKLDDGAVPEFIYQKTDGEWLKLKVLKFKNYTEEYRETLWIFSSTGRLEELMP